jgi:hypothetical protein
MIFGKFSGRRKPLLPAMPEEAPKLRLNRLRHDDKSEKDD